MPRWRIDTEQGRVFYVYAKTRNKALDRLHKVFPNLDPLRVRKADKDNDVTWIEK